MSFSWPKQGRFKARLLMRFSYKDGWPSNANLSLINPPLLARHLTREKNSPCTSIRNKVLSPPILSISKKTISPVRFPSFFLIKVCNPQTLFLLDSSAHGSRTSLISLYNSVIHVIWSPMVFQNSSLLSCSASVKVMFASMDTFSVAFDSTISPSSSSYLRCNFRLPISEDNLCLWTNARSC